MTAYSTAAPLRRGRELARLAHLDRLIVELAVSLGADRRQYPVLVSRDALERAEYPRAFPHLILTAIPLVSPEREPSSLFERDNLDAPSWFLSPAVCYHVYAELAASTLETPTVITARGRCFRNEAQRSPGIRQLEFEMREIVLAGPKDWVENMAHHAQTRLESLARSLGLDGAWEVAKDPFFLPAASGKALMQRLRQTKLEYQNRGRGPVGLALASVNRHGTFFGERFGISDASGQPIQTACVAVGLDRWLSLVNPDQVREVNHAAHPR
jgi:seryl-tRNA synthetase